jgi:DNA-binding response OmpR family regulator
MTMRVLIIEDDMDISKILVLRFKAAGFEVRQAPDGVSAIKEAQQFKPDVITLDMMLPAGGGWGALKNLKLSLYTNTIPIIVYTGMDDELRKKEVEALGIDAYFKKPDDPQKVVEKAIELINRTGESSQ